MNNDTTKKSDLGEEVTLSDFLGLTPEEETIVRIRLALHQGMKELRRESNISQTEIARRIGSSQSRVAKAERGDSNVSFELLIKAMLASGATPRKIGDIIGSATSEMVKA